jgi:hypothetical protein
MIAVCDCDCIRVDVARDGKVGVVLSPLKCTT